MFSKAWFFCFFMGGRRAKNDTLLPISVCHTLYIKNCRSYWDFWYTSVKWWHLQMFFLFFFFKFWFSVLLVEKKGNKWPKMTKNPFCLTLCLRNCTSHDCGFWYTCFGTCVKWYLQAWRGMASDRARTSPHT